MKRQTTLIAILLMLFGAVAGCSQKEMADATASADYAPSAHSAKAQQGSGAVDGRKLKRTAYLTIEVDEEESFPAVIEATRTLTDEYGGYVAGESTTSIEVMIPTERLDEALASVSEKGDVSSKSVRVQDVTAQYVDLEARIDNLEKMRTRIQALMAKSGDMEDMLKAEQELNRVTTELEQAKAQMRRMERDTTYARLHVSVEKDIRPGPVGWVFYGLYKGVKWLFIWD